MSGELVPIHGDIIGAGQVTLDAEDAGVVMGLMAGICNVKAVTLGAERIGGRCGVGLLGVDLMTVHTADVGDAVAAGLPFRQGDAVAVAAKFRRAGNGHALFRVLRTIWSVAGFTGDAGQHELAGVGVIARGVAGQTFPWLVGLFEIGTEDGIKESVGVGGVRPGFKLLLVALPAQLRTLVVAEQGKETAWLCIAKNKITLRPDQRQGEGNDNNDKRDSEGKPLATLS